VTPLSKEKSEVTRQDASQDQANSERSSRRSLNSNGVKARIAAETKAGAAVLSEGGYHYRYFTTMAFYPSYLLPRSEKEKKGSSTCPFYAHLMNW
jgi:hypothetical protein